MATIFRREYEGSDKRGRDYPLVFRTWLVSGLALTVQTPTPPKLVQTTETPRSAIYPVDLRTVTQRIPGPLFLDTPQPSISKQSTETPRGPFYPYDLRTTALGTPAALAAGPLPNYLLRAANKAPQPIAPYDVSLRTTTLNLLETTLLVPTPPFFPAVEASPQLPGYYPQDLRTITGPPSLNLTVPQIPLPVGQTAPPLARGVDAGSDFPVTLRTWVVPPPTALTTVLATYVTRPGFYVPRMDAGYPVTLRGAGQGANLSLLVAPVVPPFINYDWPAWTAAQYSGYPTNLRTSIFYYVEDLNNPPQPFNGQFTLPRAADYPTTLRTFNYNSLALTVSSPKPQNQQYDYPVPTPSAYPPSLRTTTLNLLQSTLAGPNVKPVGGAVTETIPGAPYPVSLRAMATNLQQTTLFVGVLTPFKQTDWPLPIPRSYLHELRTYTKGMDLRLKGQDQFFGGPGQPPSNHDWPAPIGPAYPVALRTSITIPHFSTSSTSLVRRHFNRSAGGRSDQDNG